MINLQFNCLFVCNYVSLELNWMYFNDEKKGQIKGNQNCFDYETDEMIK